MKPNESIIKILIFLICLINNSLNSQTKNSIINSFSSNYKLNNFEHTKFLADNQRDDLRKLKYFAFYFIGSTLSSSKDLNIISLTTIQGIQGGGFDNKAYRGVGFTYERISEDFYSIGTKTSNIYTLFLNFRIHFGSNLFGLADIGYSFGSEKRYKGFYYASALGFLFNISSFGLCLDTGYGGKGDISYLFVRLGIGL